MWYPAARRRRAHLVSFVLTAAVFMAACGGGDDDSASTDPDPTDPPASATTAATDAPGTTEAAPETTAADTTVPATTASESTVPPAEDLPTLTFTPQSAGPLSVTASQCVVEGIPDGVPDAAVESFALNATHAFVPVAGGVAALAFTPGVDCSMVLDPAIGDGGVLTTADEVSSVAAAATGRVAATGLFGGYVFDVPLGQSYACDHASGYVDLSADGSTLMTSFPGSPVEQFALTDTGCGPATEIALPAEIVDRYFVAFDGSDLFVGGQFDDDTVYGGRASGGVLQWAVGNAEVGGPGWIGWVHGLVPCNGGYCLLDTNTDKLVVLDAAGTLRAEFTVSELIGSRMFYQTLEAGPDGAVYLLATDSAPDGAGDDAEGNYVVRIEVTG
ncbi:MAG: hypothetical protein KDB40_16305 [Acidimicrobiales bacterium]|nr:hypothetical protein [Acidimicrobiales bacterium]